ncbi:Nicotianamine synthase [Phaeosphaeria sp. MPI-PUGE-AT-0046c]|nr:Nicotianamine synthase [Phaeosphaeria sp. MPI-PUGE-AT-0046c]
MSSRPDYTSFKTANGTEHSSETFTPPRTPTSNTTSAHILFTEIQSIYTSLSSLPSLAPGEEINGLLTRLVQLCIEPHSPSFTSSFFAINSVPSLCESLRPICASAEGELEAHWAQRICTEACAPAAPPSKKELLGLFPYHQNYIDLSLIECATLSAFLSKPAQRVAFVGSGPLPLTSLCMLDRYPEATVHNIDRDEDALRVSSELCEKLGYRGMTFAREDVMCADSGSATPWADFEVVFLAALVGMDTESKLSILASLAQKMRPGALVVARSARGLRAVLYPVLELSMELDKTGLEVLAEVHPWTKVVNSVIVMRVKER